MVISLRKRAAAKASKVASLKLRAGTASGTINKSSTSEEIHSKSDDNFASMDDEGSSWAQLTRPMREASASSKGAASAAGRGTILGNKRNISEVTEMSEEENRLRDQINEKNDQIAVLNKMIERYENKLETIKPKVAKYERLCDNDPNNDIYSRRLGRYEKAETTATLNLVMGELTKLNDKLEKLLEGMLIIFKYLGIY